MPELAQVRIPQELQRQAKSAAALRGLSLTDWLTEAVQEKLARDKK